MLLERTLSLTCVLYRALQILHVWLSCRVDTTLACHPTTEQDGVSTDGTGDSTAQVRAVFTGGSWL